MPAPNASNLVLRLYYSPMVADLSGDSDVPDVPEQFMEYVAIIAAYNGFIKDDRVPDNLIVKAKGYEELMKKAVTQRTQDRSRSVVITNDYAVGSWY